MDIFNPPLYHFVGYFRYMCPITTFYWVVALLVCYFLAVRKSGAGKAKDKLLIDFLMVTGIAMLIIYGCLAWVAWTDHLGAVNELVSLTNTQKQDYYSQFSSFLILRTGIIAAMMLYVGYIRWALLPYRRRKKK